MKNPYHPPSEVATPEEHWGPVGRGAFSIACCVGSLWIVWSGAHQFLWRGGLQLVPLFTKTQLFWFAIWGLLHAGSAFGLAWCAFWTLRHHRRKAIVGFSFFCAACFAAWLFRIDFLGFNT